jgi:hypothetical protein
MLLRMRLTIRHAKIQYSRVCAPMAESKQIVEQARERVFAAAKGSTI